MLDLKEITKKYGDRYALKNVNVVANESEIIGLVGRNGAGKTTLLEITAGLIEPTHGEIRLNNLVNYDADLVGYLEDDPFFYEYLTVKEIIHYYTIMRNNQISSLHSDNLLKEYQLYDKRDSKIKDLSRGMKQLLGFLLTTLHQPKLLLLDEPFTGLDPNNLRLKKNKLLELKNKGKVIIISTHILSFASEICNRILFLDHGQIRYETKEKYLTEKKLEGLFNEFIK